MMMDAVYLFVYGTLRPGSSHSMAKFLADHARHVGPAKMPGRLYNLGRYPGMVAAVDADDWVIGDIFQIADADPVLARLDEYEGATGEAPRLFERKRGAAHLESGATVEAWHYQYQRMVPAKAWIRSGVFEPRP
jgi:gamma-glutamylcyclotransferase (GGCT)/AIG2-like uncharacterized protein YtfP